MKTTVPIVCYNIIILTVNSNIIHYFLLNLHLSIYKLVLI